MGDDWRTVRFPGGSAIPVRRDSPLDVAFSFGALAEVPMPWSLGHLGDLMWMTLPETRPFLAAQIVSEVEDALEYGRQLGPLLPGTLASHALWHPVMRPALDEYPNSRDRVAGHLRFLYEVYKSVEPDQTESPDQLATREALDSYVIDWLREPAYREIVDEVVPELAALIDHGTQ